MARTKADDAVILGITGEDAKWSVLPEGYGRPRQVELKRVIRTVTQGENDKGTVYSMQAEFPTFANLDEVLAHCESSLTPANRAAGANQESVLCNLVTTAVEQSLRAAYGARIQSRVEGPAKAMERAEKAIAALRAAGFSAEDLAALVS